VKAPSKFSLGLVLAAAAVAVGELPFLEPPPGFSTGKSIVEEEKGSREERERALGDQRPGVFPPEAIQGSGSGTTIGRADNPFSTKGRPLRGDQWD
jgi:hypothetical protein